MNTLMHLPCSLSGERQGQDFITTGFSFKNQTKEPITENRGLA